ncbi:MAG: sensor histidine kinase [Pseudomonadota bacterium]
MKFSTFIKDNLTAIVDEWEVFARTLPAAQAMSRLALRDHCQEILYTIVQDMQTSQTDAQQSDKAMGLAPALEGADESAAESHGTLRHLAGFDLVQLVAEFRAMRASVLSLWERSAHGGSTEGAIEEITRFNEGLDQALAESVERYSANVAASRDMFLGVLGHDLRGPLSSIAMSNQLLAMADLPAASRQRASGRVARAIKDMTGLIEDLLDYTRSRLGAGIPIAQAPCDLGQVCREAIDLIEGSHPEQPFVLTLEGNLATRADASKLGQALGNLLNNAVQHGDRQSPISLKATGEPEAIVLQIVNQGEAIPPEAFRAIFEPLAQLRTGHADESDERSRTSMGLGLFIVREIVNGHCGAINVESTLKTGTVFTVRLPRECTQPA